MLKNSSKRRSIYKEFPSQQFANINANSGNKNQQPQMQTSSSNQTSSTGGSTCLSSQSGQQKYQLQQNQRLSIIARLIPEDDVNQKYESKEGIRQERCIFKLNKHEIQIIEPDEKKILEDFDGFQKREKIQHSPPQSIMANQFNEKQQRSNSPFNYESNNNPTYRNEGNVNQQQEFIQKQRRDNVLDMTPEKEKKDNYIKPFQSPISKINYQDIYDNNDSKRPNTFTFDNIFEESVGDQVFSNKIQQIYFNCIRNGRNLVLLNTNRSLLSTNSFLKEFVQELVDLQQRQEFLNLVSDKTQFFLNSYEIIHPSNEKMSLFELQPINKQDPDEVIKSIRVKLSQIPRKLSQSCSVHNFLLYEENKLINEIVLIDMNSFLDKKSQQSSQQQQYSVQQNYNSYCNDLINLLNFQYGGQVNPSDLFQQIFLQKFKLNDELIILANFRVGLPHITTNYYLLLLSQILNKFKVYQNSMFMQFCQIQNQSMHQLFNRDLSYDKQNISIKEENQILAQKNSMLKDQIKVFTADLIYHQEQLVKLKKENNLYLSDIKSLKQIIYDQDSILQANKKKITEQTSRIDGMKKNFGILDNFDRSMMVDSKNKSYNNILSNIYSSKKMQIEHEFIDSSTQTDGTHYINQLNNNKDQSNKQQNIQNIDQPFNSQQQKQSNKENQQNFISQQQQLVCKYCQQQFDKTFFHTEQKQNNMQVLRSFNVLQDQINSEFENLSQSQNEEDKNSIITPNRYLQHLDDILSNLDSKRSAYFSPRNLSLANLALIENEGYKQKLIIKNQEIDKLQIKLKDINLQLSLKDQQFRFKEHEKLQNLKTIEKLINMFENKLMSNEEIIQQVVEYYESEILDMKEIIQFGFLAFFAETKALKKEIQEALNEKQAWGQVLTKKTEEIIRQMSIKLKQKNDIIKQYEEGLEIFGKRHANV